MNKFHIWWQKRFALWLDKRIPHNRLFIMDMSNTFIFPSKFGVSWCGLSALLFILGTNYRNNLLLLLSYFLVAIFLVCLLKSFSNFAKLRIQCGKISSPFAMHDLILPLWLGTHDRHQYSDKSCQGRLHFRIWNKQLATSVEAQLCANPINVNIPTRERGFMELPRITIESFYPLGLFRCWTHLKFDNSVLIYATPQECTPPQRPEHSSQDQTNQVTSSQSGYDDFDLLDSYKPGEPLNHVAWKIVAKGGEMLTKHFSTANSDKIWLSLEQVSGNYETRLSKLTWLVLEYSQKQLEFGLNLQHIKVQPGMGNQHMETCFRALATSPKAIKSGNQNEQN